MTMHQALADEIVEVCRQRLAEGDCPLVKAPSAETLEDCIIELASQRDDLRAKLAIATEPDGECEAGSLHWDAPASR